MDFEKMFNEVEEFIDGLVHEKLSAEYETEDGEYRPEYVKYNIPEYDTNLASPVYERWDYSDHEFERLYEAAADAITKWIMYGLFAGDRS